MSAEVSVFQILISLDIAISFARPETDSDIIASNEYKCNVILHTNLTVA